MVARATSAWKCAHGPRPTHSFHVRSAGGAIGERDGVPAGAELEQCAHDLGEEHLWHCLEAVVDDHLLALPWRAGAPRPECPLRSAMMARCAYAQASVVNEQVSA